MSRIQETLSGLRRRGEKALIAYLTGGFPDLDTTREIVLAMEDGGADIIEIGIPFSDPIADGPTIQFAATQALQAGIRVVDLLHLVAELRQQTAVPLVLMTYYNPVFSFGLECFCQQAAACGVDGLIVPDLSYEESAPLRVAAENNNLDLIPLIAPTSTAGRIKTICSGASGFIYCVSVTGVTGGQEEIRTDLSALSSMIKSCTNLPVAIGFGISDPSTARQVAQFADAVVVGSSLVRLVIEGRYQEIKPRVTELKSAVHGA